MFTAIKVLLTAVLGTALGWLLLAAFCQIPGLREGVACGHNAYLWLPLFIPMGAFVSWYLLGQLERQMKAQKNNSFKGEKRNA